MKSMWRVLLLAVLLVAGAAGCRPTGLGDAGPDPVLPQADRDAGAQVIHDAGVDVLPVDSGPPVTVCAVGAGTMSGASSVDYGNFECCDEFSEGRVCPYLNEVPRDFGYCGQVAYSSDVYPHTQADGGPATPPECESPDAVSALECFNTAALSPECPAKTLLVRQWTLYEGSTTLYFTRLSDDGSCAVDVVRMLFDGGAYTFTTMGYGCPRPALCNIQIGFPATMACASTTTSPCANFLGDPLACSGD